MGQTDIIDWLRVMRASSKFKDRFFYVREIEQAMVLKGVSIVNIHAQLNALYVYHYLDVRRDEHFLRRYRLKQQYAIKDSSGGSCL